jgi:hypothetical protein
MTLRVFSMLVLVAALLLGGVMLPAAPASAAASTVAAAQAAATAQVGAGVDRPGSRDPYGVERVPRSWIVEYQRDDEMRQRDFVMGRVDRIRRELRVEDQLRLDATLEAVTYQMPDGVSVAEVVQHYREELGGDLLFRCEGRGCGRSNDWANQIFRQAILYGPDINQYYSAWEWQDRLVGLYVIERGNRRVYAHLQVLEPGSDVDREPNRLLVRRLSERGWASIEAVVPDDDGGFDATGERILSGLADELARFGDEPIYLVCHLYGSRSTDDLLSLSQRCAERGAELIGAVAGGAPAVRPFGVGPLSPRAATNRSRLEVVLPATVSRVAGE